MLVGPTYKLRRTMALKLCKIKSTFYRTSDIITVYTC